MSGYSPPAVSPHPPVRRGVQLIVGLVVCGLGLTGIIEAHLGLDPWDVLHQGISRRLGIPIGTVVIGAGFTVLLLWIPLRQRPGIGTIANALVIGSTIDVVSPHVHRADPGVQQWAFLAFGIAGMAVGGGMYLGTMLGPGPRDGLMTGLASRGMSLGLARTLVELSALGAGWLLGGDVGLGTLAFALLVGPGVHLAVPLFSPSAPKTPVAAVL